MLNPVRGIGIEPRVYQHFRGDFYLFICYATSTEHVGKTYVIYTDLILPGKIWARDQREFDAYVQISLVDQVKRFRLLTEEEARTRFPLLFPPSADFVNEPI